MSDVDVRAGWLCSAFQTQLIQPLCYACIVCCRLLEDEVAALCCSLLCEQNVGETRRAKRRLDTDFLVHGLQTHSPLPYGFKGSLCR